MTGLNREDFEFLHHPERVKLFDQLRDVEERIKNCRDFGTIAHWHILKWKLENAIIKWDDKNVRASK